MRVLGQLRARLRELSETLAAVSPASSFWASLTENPLTIDMAGWRFTYTIRRDPGHLEVLAAVRICDVVPGYRGESARGKRGA